MLCSRATPGAVLAAKRRAVVAAELGLVEIRLFAVRRRRQRRVGIADGLIAGLWR